MNLERWYKNCLWRSRVSLKMKLFSRCWDTLTARWGHVQHLCCVSAGWPHKGILWNVWFAPHSCAGVRLQPAAPWPLQPVCLDGGAWLTWCSGLCLHLQVTNCITLNLRRAWRRQSRFNIKVKIDILIYCSWVKAPCCCHPGPSVGEHPHSSIMVCWRRLDFCLRCVRCSQV